ncbi:hypothetical protein [Streptomyces mirabilis]|uniref:hypothetical protein n=1 Tax=Streptomyces mirabilis TaxID=68239 RepID=UPI0036D94BD1
MKSLLSSIVLGSLFLVGLSATVASGAVLDGTQKDVATYGGIALSLMAGSRIAKKDPIKSFLSSPPVLWFLFLFNRGRPRHHHLRGAARTQGHRRPAAARGHRGR